MGWCWPKASERWNESEMFKIYALNSCLGATRSIFSIFRIIISLLTVKCDGEL